ncbi:MAG: SUMF1/EgtB/PvdO family nonheme iron enzyme [Phycisphaerales bacterium]
MLSLSARGGQRPTVSVLGVTRASAVVIALLCLPGPALSAVTSQMPAQPQWAHVTSAGNAPYRYTDPGLGERAIGRVDHDYYIRTTEITGGEWFEFVNAAKRYVPTNAQLGSTFIGEYTTWDLHSDGTVTHYLNDVGINRPITTAWRYAAMYCNWLHNNKGTDISSFLTGAYTLDGTTNYELPFAAREPGARYWLPSEDEWAKAAYFDLGRDGPNQPGYWQYPNGTSTPLIPGQPETGAQTSGGVLLSFEFPLRPEVGAYPETVSPWGLLDVSGGPREWTDSASYSGGLVGDWQGYLQLGSRYGDLGITDVTDRLGHYSSTHSNSASNGIRLASSVPSVGTSMFFLLPFAWHLARRRKVTP